jgi:hypothetical protein
MPSAGPVQSAGFDHFHGVTTQYGIAAPLPLDPYCVEMQTFRNYGGLIIRYRSHLPVVDLLQSNDIRLMEGNHFGNTFRRYLEVSSDAAVNVIRDDTKTVRHWTSLFAAGVKWKRGPVMRQCSTNCDS